MERKSIFIDRQNKWAALRGELIAQAHVSFFQHPSNPPPFDPLETQSVKTLRQDLQRTIVNSLKSTKTEMLERMEVVGKKMVASEVSMQEQIKALGSVVQQLKNGASNQSKAIDLITHRENKLEKELGIKLKTEINDKLLHFSEEVDNQIADRIKASQKDMLKKMRNFIQIFKEKVETGLKSNLQHQLITKITEETSRLQEKLIESRLVPKVDLDLRCDPQREAIKAQISALQDHEEQKRKDVECMLNDLEQRMKTRSSELQQEIKNTRQSNLYQKWQSLSSEIRELKDSQASLEESIIMRLSRIDQKDFQSDISDNLQEIPAIVFAKKKEQIQLNESLSDQFRFFRAEKNRHKAKQNRMSAQTHHHHHIPDELGTPTRHEMQMDCKKTDQFSFNSNVSGSKNEVKRIERDSHERSEGKEVQGVCEEYQVDEEGHLLDGQGLQLTNQQGQPIKLDSSQIELLRKSNLLQQ